MRATKLDGATSKPEPDERVPAEVRAEWGGDHRGARILDAEGIGLGTLHLRPWYGKGDRVPGLAWVISFLDPKSDEPLLISEEVEHPAAAANTKERQES